MSTDSSPFISVVYEDEEFPSAYEHSQMGYDPDRVFLSQDTDEVEMDQGLDIEADSLKEFFSEMMDIDLVFRYQNGKATRTREEADQGEINEYRTAPAYSFDTGSAELDPNDAWMKRLDEVTETVGVENIDNFQIETQGIPYHDIEGLEKGLQRKSVQMDPDIQGAASLKYSWGEDRAEIDVYSDTYTVPGPGGGDMRGLMDLHRSQMTRTVRYGVDRESIRELQQDLEQIVEEVEINILPQRFMPPEVERQIQ